MDKDVWLALGAAVAFAHGGLAFAAETTEIDVHAVDARGVGERLGTVTAQNSAKGLLLNLRLRGLPPGEHGLHVHQNPDCGPKVQDGKPVAGAAAGGHYDPKNTGRHAGPHGDGHLGDLPRIAVDADGSATTTVLAPRLSLADIRGRSLMIHGGGDNYADRPKPLGGGGARIACGVIG
jgi:Cu-Zn family superoxide dismutase